MRFYWNERTVGDDIRFWSYRYRSGGPWITTRTVHDLVARYGVAFRWRGNWRFFGLLVLENKRTTREAEAAAARPQLAPPPMETDMGEQDIADSEQKGRMAEILHQQAGRPIGIKPAPRRAALEKEPRE